MMKNKIIISFLFCSSLAVKGQIEQKEYVSPIWSIPFPEYQSSNYNHVMIPEKEKLQKVVKQNIENNNSFKVTDPINTTDMAISSSNNFTHSENSVFISPVDPDIILNSNNFSTWPTISSVSVSGQFSNDGGFTWTGVNGNLNNSLGDPATAIDLNGTFYIGYVDKPNLGQAISIFDATTNIWNEFPISSGSGLCIAFVFCDLLDKNHLWVDNSPVSLFSNRLYSAWTNLNFIAGDANVSEIEISFSDGGQNWSIPQEISSDVNAGSFNQGVNIQTGPNGEVYVCWAIYDGFPLNEVAIGFTKSLDGGQAWVEISPGITSERIQNIDGHANIALGGGKTMRHNSFPVMTVNMQNGEIYIVWTNIGVPGIGTGDPDIYMIKSSDNGVNWSTPIRVNQDVIGNSKDQWFPWIACDEVTGALVVIYYDSRNFTANDRAETFVSISYDGGNTWEDFRISDDGEDWSGDGIVGFGDNYAGDYIGIDVSHGKVVPVWSDDRTGNMLAYTQPFSLPCPQDLALCNATITGDAVYKVANTITVGGAGCNYTVTSTGNVIMEAGTEIIFTGDIEITGNLIATINPACGSFGDARLADSNPANSNETKDESIAKIEYQKRAPDVDKYYFTRFYPNPADNFTNIEYIITNNSDVHITIYNANGNLIGNIVNNTNQPKGKYQIRFDAGNLIPGLYLCTITTKDYTASHKFSVIRK